jgi:hypothetical protein
VFRIDVADIVSFIVVVISDASNCNRATSIIILNLIPLVVFTHLAVIMKFFSLALLIAAAVARTHGFAPAHSLAFRARTASRSTASLSMVADDAKVILVTGSSRGLGKAIAVDLGKHGQKVIVNYVSDSSNESAQATVDEIKAAGGDAVAIQADSKC